MGNKAVVLFSGGQDSTTVLGKALRDGFECYAIGFDYGQRHKIELECARDIADKVNVPYKVINLGALGEMVTTGLTQQGTDLSQTHPRYDDLPASFVPNRNALFLTFAHAYAQELGARMLWGGMCQTDFSGYPDCRRVFIDAMQRALNVGYRTDIVIITPLMDINKAATWKLAEDVGILDIVINDTNTCYNGDRTLLHDWGYGCGDCPACKLRAKGWNEYKGT